MPRATSGKLSKQSTAPSAANSKASSSSSGTSGSRNAIFNTADLGQHILKNPLVAQAIVDKAALKSSDKVLEVGPGTGNLTVRILPACKSCTAIEMDPRMAAEVAKRVQGKDEQKKLNVINGDFMKAELDYFDVVISNTPYQISSPLVFKLLSHRPLFRCAVLMFQREFAARLLARPGDKFWSRLSCNVQLYAKVDLVLKVSRNSFRPPPQVDSSVVRLAPLDPPPPVRFEEFDGLTRIAFNRRNKSLRANMQASGVKEMLTFNRQAMPVAQDMDVDQIIDKVLEECEAHDSRAAKMDVEDFLALLAAFHKYGLHFS